MGLSRTPPHSETQSYPPLYVISFSLISHGSKAESLIPLCLVLKIFMFWLLLSDRLWGPWEWRIWLPIFAFILFGVWNSADSQKINFIESFFQEGWQLGSELSNQSCIKYPMLGLHGISHFIYFTDRNSPLFGFINMIIKHFMYMKKYSSMCQIDLLFFGISFSSQVLIH